MREEGWQRFNDDDQDNWSGEVTVLSHGAKAMKVVHENEESFVPYSQIHDDSEIWKASKVGETGKLVIPEWMAVKKGWA